MAWSGYYNCTCEKQLLNKSGFDDNNQNMCRVDGYLNKRLVNTHQCYVRSREILYK